MNQNNIPTSQNYNPSQSAEMPSPKTKIPIIVVIIAIIMLITGIMGLRASFYFLILGIFSWDQSVYQFIQGILSVLVFFGLIFMKKWALYLLIIAVALEAIHIGQLYLVDKGAVAYIIGGLIDAAILTYLWIIHKKFA